jgi:predicted DNA-binding mobile mystery protein A
MKKQKLIMEQTDRKILLLKKADALVIPPTGWIFTIRTALGMSMRQLGKRMGITPQSIKEIEDRERNKSISLKVLCQFAEALDMKFIYGFVPEAGSLEELIERRALEMAKEIVGRTSVTMKIEDQENVPKRIKKAVREKADVLKNEIPKYLWD